MRHAVHLLPVAATVMFGADLSAQLQHWARIDYFPSPPKASAYSLPNTQSKWLALGRVPAAGVKAEAMVLAPGSKKVMAATEVRYTISGIRYSNSASMEALASYTQASAGGEIACFFETGQPTAGSISISTSLLGTSHVKVDVDDDGRIDLGCSLSSGSSAARISLPIVLTDRELAISVDAIAAVPGLFNTLAAHANVELGFIPGGLGLATSGSTCGASLGACAVPLAKNSARLYLWANGATDPTTLVAVGVKEASFQIPGSTCYVRLDPLLVLPVQANNGVYELNDKLPLPANFLVQYVSLSQGSVLKSSNLLHVALK